MSAEPIELRPYGLTARELEILQHVANGLITKQVARRMGLGLSTVKNELTSTLAKLDVQSRCDAALMGVREGWLT